MDPKKPLPDPMPPSRDVPEHAVPEIDDRANQAFLDNLIDTDGRPMRDAVDLPEDEEELDEDDDEFDRDPGDT
ncbi:hypothetical protein K32_06330 [Kaistia sp. 32K]|uniref:hypothetical protein n=1 Tax=Kaistia sp. 32K TaxID=2795690 RepID=UPI001915A422|nr:hypothetical protein [Kaistia sp. 32K]BCP52016.1 hypothetical protein K32_06330 [Kaistia sp. 32K]